MLKMLRLNFETQFLLVTFYIIGCSTFKPYFDFYPESKEILIREGESLEITCVSTRHIQMFYPLSDDLNRTITSTHEITFEKQNGSFARWKFRRSKTVFGDTGWYGCADIVAEISSDNYSHPNASFIYVYVQSNISGFTEISQSNRTIFINSESFTIPCRTTSPYLNVTLFGSDGKNQHREIQDASFNPKMGFQLNISHQQENTNLLCYTANKNISYIISYKIKRNTTFFYKNAKIAIKDRYLYNGSLLKGMCSINVEINTNVSCLFSWPRSKFNSYENSTDTSFQMEIEEYKIGLNFKEIVFSFNIFEITFNDMGRYTCSFLSEEAVSVVEKHVSVQDQVDYTIFVVNKEEVIEGKNITLGCSTPYQILRISSLWKSSYMQFLEDSEKFKIFGTRTASYITIFNLSKADETTVICAEDNRSIFFSNPGYFDLSIKRPMPARFLDTNLNGTKIVVENGTRPNQPILKCSATGVPKPVITWYKNGVELKENVNLKSLPVHYKHAMTRYVSQNENKILIVTEFLRNKYENYSCVAKNSYGHVEAYQIYTVTNSSSNNNSIWITITSLLVTLLFLMYIAISTYIKFGVYERNKYLQEVDFVEFKNGETILLNSEIMINDQIDLFSYDEKWKFNKDNFELENRLGSGSFGIVFKAKAYGVKCGEEVANVAVKMVHPYAEPYQIQALINELKVMIHLDKHLNIVNLFGVYADNIMKRELMLIVEYCHYGNLHDYLYKQRKRSINNQIEPKAANRKFANKVTLNTSHNLACYNHNINKSNSDLNKVDKENIQDTRDNLVSVNTQDLLHWALQVASGMEYISQKRVIHGDLAARNILLTQNNVVKICDFGLAKIIDESEYYTRKSHGRLPFKWLAPESIRYRVFSCQTDIWSFGIVMWEFFTLAKIPYHQMNAEQQIKKLLGGYRLDKPKYATNEIYNLMLHCWNEQSALRPTFSELVEKIGHQLSTPEESKI